MTAATPLFARQPRASWRYGAGDVRVPARGGGLLPLPQRDPSRQRGLPLRRRAQRREGGKRRACYTRACFTLRTPRERRLQAKVDPCFSHRSLQFVTFSVLLVLLCNWHSPRLGTGAAIAGPRGRLARGARAAGMCAGAHGEAQGYGCLPCFRCQGGVVKRCSVRVFFCVIVCAR